ncbi:MAG TPA: PH domain-containing protein [Candidatus Limnocylindria bacterium]|nr:PH domain-containing protein [Candidatus Limnocylindria bacterium]
MARYADKLLADGERVAMRGRQHFLATIVDGRVAWAILIAALVLVVLDLQLEPGLARDLFGWLGLGLLVVGLAWLTQIYLSWYAQDYVVTNRRVMVVEGILNKRSADSSLEKINDAVLEQNVFGRMLGYGDLDILTANDQSVDRLRMLAEAQQFKRTMLDQKFRLEQESFQIPGPPLRAPAASTPAAAPASTPAAAPGAPSAESAPTRPSRREMSSEEITSSLGRLADLRDRGAITTEEYEAKKADLLGRL